MPFIEDYKRQFFLLLALFRSFEVNSTGLDFRSATQSRASTVTKGLVTNDGIACWLKDNRRWQQQRKRRQSIGRLVDNTRAMFDFFFLFSIQSFLSIQSKESAYSLQVEQVGIMVMSSVEETLVNISLLSSSSPLKFSV